MKMLYKYQYDLTDREKSTNPGGEIFPLVWTVCMILVNIKICLITLQIV